MTHVQVCRLCQLCQCLLCLAKGWESGEKGTKRYGRRENRVWEAGGCDHPLPPPSLLTENCGNNSLEFHLGCFISLQTGNYAGYVHEIKSISETSSYWKNCTEKFQNWQLCIVCEYIFFLCVDRRTILNSSMSGRKAKQVEHVIKYRPVSDHEMNVSTVHVHTKL